MKPFYEDSHVKIYNASASEVCHHVIYGRTFDAVITDPSYEETSMEWDKWLTGWPAMISLFTNQLWSFGSTRMFLKYGREFSDWDFAQDVVWEKHNGSSLHKDRFRKVHELALHFYRGPWRGLYINPVKTMDAQKRTARRLARPQHWGGIGTAMTYKTEQGGPRLMRSVINVRSCHGHAIHPTQKPEGIVEPLIRYSVPPSGIILDPFMGSGTTLAVAKKLGMRAIGIEGQTRYCEKAAERLSKVQAP